MSDEAEKVAETIETQADKIQATIDLLVASYDARILASILLARSAGLYNSLRLLNVVSVERLYGYLEVAIDIIMDDTLAVPKVCETPASPNDRLN